jgi:triacylglycerol esterase/lipase EstA (alpha/beta hydrolase family)
VLLRITAELVAAVCAGGVSYVMLSYTLAFVARPRRWGLRLLRAALVEILVIWAIVPLWPLWWVLGGLYEAAMQGVGDAGGRRNPIILLHGFGMNRTQWVWMARSLRARGHGPIYGMNYFSLQPVTRSARLLARFIDVVLAREGSRQVDVVAHSMGGVVARYYNERLTDGRKIGRLITIGTPHAGTRMGRLGPGIPGARDLLGGSALFGELGPVRAGAPYTSIWSRADAVVQPAESASIAPGGTDEVFDDLGHLSLVLSPRVVAAIDARLRAPEPV